MSDAKNFGCIILVLGVIAVVVFMFSMIFNGVHVETGSGQHTGYVTAVSKQGLIWKTGRAYIKTDTQSSQEDSYCIISDNVYNKLASESEKHSKVTVKFISYLSAGLTQCEGEGEIIVDFKIEQ